MILLRQVLAKSAIKRFDSIIHNDRMKIYKGRNFLLYSLLSLLLCLILNSCGSKKLEPTKTGLVNTDSIPTQESFKTTVTFSDSGNVKAVLKAGRIRQFAKFNYT